jgi:hypothetical protein
MVWALHADGRTGMAKKNHKRQLKLPWHSLGRPRWFITKLKMDQVITLGIEEEFQIVEVGFGPSELCNTKSSN